MPDVENPYTPEDITKIRESIELAKKTELGINKGKSAGMDNDELLKSVRENRNKLERILSVYG